MSGGGGDGVSGDGLDWRVHLGLAVLTVAVLGLQLRPGPMYYDLGELLLYTQAVLDGRTPGVDVVVNGYGPGRYLLLAVLIAVTGMSPLAAAWAVFVALRVVLSSLLWELGRRMLPTRWAWVPVAGMLLAPGPPHKGFFLVGTVALALAARPLLRDPDRRALLRFGAVVGVAAVFRLDLGLFGALLLTGFAVRARSARLWLTGAAIPAGVLLLLVAVPAAMGVLGPVLSQVAHDVLVNQRVPWPTFPSPGELVTTPSVSRALLWAPVVILGGLALSLRRGGRPAEWLLVVLGVLVANQVRMKPDFGHLLQTGPILWTCAALLGARLGRSGAALVAVLGGSLVVATAMEQRGSPYTGAWTIPLVHTEPVETRAGTLWAARGEAEGLRGVLRWVEAREGDLWIPANEPLLYALTGRPDRVGVVGLLYVADDPERQADLLARLERARPTLAVFRDTTMEGPTRHLRRAAPPVAGYLDVRYVEELRIGEWSLRVRRE